MLDVMEIDIDRPEKIVYVVGLGPGEPFYMTQQAANTLESVDAICGYKVYLDLIRDEFPCEEYYATGMTQELDRCRWALEKARTGKRVALVCSGDAGVYGMASPLLELTPDYPDVAVEVVPGLTAALSGGAVLGAPLAHDFCVISLSDRLTPWEVIEKRLACAAMGDFCVALYNPSSKGRPDYLAKAVCILLSLLALGVKNMYLGPTLPAFLSESVVNILVDTYGLQPITAPEQDLDAILHRG